MKTVKTIMALAVCLLLTALPALAQYPLDQQTTYYQRDLCDGVTLTHLATPEGSRYQTQDMHIVEFDPRQDDLYFNVVAGGRYANDRSTVSDTVKRFDSENPDLTPLAAVNGDLWMMGSAHSRVEGKGTSYGGYSDPVVKAELTLPRGFNMYGGEIICSAYMYTETPYEGEFWSFGMTADGRAVIGCPTLDIGISSTKGSVAADGLNRLPANDSLVVYTDRGCLSNYAISDAYELVVDMGGDYTVTDGARLTGRIADVYDDTVDADPSITDTTIILTARGSAVSRLTGFTVGDEITLSFDIGERYGRDVDVWREVTDAVGGHMPFVVDGVKCETGTTTGYPSTILAIKNDGRVLMIADDGRQSGFSRGLDFNDYAALADELDINTGFILDGGGSTDMVALDGGEYKVMNKPSDGHERIVENTVILSRGPGRGKANAQVRIPDDPGDLTSLYFTDPAAYALLSCNIQSQITKTGEGAFIAADKYNSDVSFSVRFGLPQTTAANPDAATEYEYPAVDIDEYPYIVLDMKVQTADPCAVQFQTVYVAAGDDWAASGGNFIGFNNILNDGGFHRCVIDTTGNSAVTGQLNAIRIGYLLAVNGVTVRNGDGVVLRSLRLARSADEAAKLARYPFSDVAAGKWYADAVGYCYESGCMTGTSQTVFAPDSPVTRAGFATIIAAMSGADLTGYGRDVFSDVPAGKWYWAPVAWAYDKGITAGTGEGKFSPDACITRQEMAVMLRKYAVFAGRSVRVNNVSLGAFPDADAVASWAELSVRWAYGNGLMTGSAAGGEVLLLPEAAATRAQVAQIVANYLK